MAGNHLREPLDYLYEELPPEKMAEVRKHLSECPECRAQMRTIRETVKLYRKAEHPIAPVGLSARTIKNALEIARNGGLPRATAEAAKSAAACTEQPRHTPAAPTVDCAAAAAPLPVHTASASALPAPAPSPVLSETEVAAAVSRRREEHGNAEFNRLKEEVLGEIRKDGWRAWLFHPAWTVAASVIFLCALLIHFSPRMMYRHEASQYFASPIRDDSTLQLRERERLPASRPLPERATPHLGTPPILQEATLMNQPPAFVPDAPEQPVPAAAAFSTPPPAARAASPAVSSPPASAPPQPKWTRKPAVEKRTKFQKKKSAPTDSKPEFSRSMRFERGAAPELPESLLARPDAAMESQSALAPQTASAASTLRPPPVDGATAEPGGDSATPVVILDGFSPDDVPQIVERPTPIDVSERVRSLTALIGMQIASGEYADARQALSILERYDAKAANEMRKLFTSVPAVVDDGKKATIGTPLPADAPMPIDKEVPVLESVPPPSEVLPPAAPADDMPPSSSRGAEADCPVEQTAPSSPLGIIEPPEDPPLSVIRRIVTELTEEPLTEKQPEEPIEDAAVPDTPLSVIERVERELPDTTTNTAARQTPGDEPPLQKSRTSDAYDAAAVEPPPSSVVEVELIVPVASESQMRQDSSQVLPLENVLEEVDFSEYFPLSVVELIGGATSAPNVNASPAPPERDGTTTGAEPSRTGTPDGNAGTADRAPVSRVRVPDNMEPAVSPEGFIQMRTGRDRTTWVAMEAQQGGAVASHASEHVVQRTEATTAAAPTLPAPSFIETAPAPAAAPHTPPTVVYTPVVPVLQPMIPVQLPRHAPGARQLPVRQARTPVAADAGKTEPYLRDF